MAIDNLIKRAKSVIDATGLGGPNNADEVNRIYKRYQQLVPAENCESIVDILNAAWNAFERPTLWNSIPQINESNREQVLKELILKNFEVFEIEKILKEERNA